MLGHRLPLSCTKALTSIRVVAALEMRVPPEFSTTENCPSSPRPAKLVGSPWEKTRQVVFSWATTVCPSAQYGNARPQSIFSAGYRNFVPGFDGRRKTIGECSIRPPSFVVRRETRIEYMIGCI